MRRALARYRLRDLERALIDLDEAVELSTRGEDGKRGLHAPDVDALRARALVRDEVQYVWKLFPDWPPLTRAGASDYSGAKLDIEAVLEESPHDILALALRAQLRGNAGDLVGAQADLAATNNAVTDETAYRSRLGDADCDLEYLMRGWAYSSVRPELSRMVASTLTFWRTDCRL